MESNLPRPSKIRKRANKACLACRARKVRCDVSQRGRPCMNCFLDSESCVVVDRASRRRKSTEEDVNGDVTTEGTSTEHLLRRGSVESSGEAPEQADGDVRMEAASDVGSYGPDTLPITSSGFSAVNTSASAKRPAATSPNRAPPYEPSQHHQSSTRARIKQLQWAGEQSTLFASDVVYSFYPFLTLSRLSRVLSQDVSYLEMQGCLRVPKKTILDEFVKQYFLHVHPILPLINEGDFWEAYGPSTAEGFESKRLSLLVFQAMLFAACAYVPSSTVRALGYPDMKSARAAFYRHAKLIFDFEAESSPIANAQAALLLSSWSPPAGTGNFWLGMAVQHAKLAGAHRYKSLYESSRANSRSAKSKRRGILKRLWWCIILSDRMVSLFTQKPTQVTILQFSREDLQDAFTLTEFADEIEGSRVYNSGAKITLIQIFMQMTRLAALLTDVLMEISPLDEAPQWDQSFSEEERSRIAHCKDELGLWYDRASAALHLPPREAVGSATESGRSEPAAGFAHESVNLYTNFICLIYQSAIVRLCHYECVRMGAQARRADAAGTGFPAEEDMTRKKSEIQQAAYKVVVCLKTLTQNRLTRWLPLNSFACVSLPLILNIIDVKLSSQPGPKVNALHDLYDSVRAYQPQQDTTDWMANSISRILDLSGLDRLDRTVVPPNRSEDPDTHRDAEGLHPSLYLRLAVSWAPDVEGAGFLGGGYPTDVGLLHILGPALMNRITSILNRDAQARKESAARPSVSASTAETQAMRQRIAAWQAHDQAVSLELGFDPADLAVAEANAEDAGSPGPSPVEDEDGTHAWKDVGDRAFSFEGDSREAKLLTTFVFRDQLPGASDASQVDWSTQERSDGPPDQEAHQETHSISPEAVQEGDIAVSRLGSIERFWTECYQQVKLPGS